MNFMEKQLININAGLDSIAKIYLEKKIDSEFKIEIIGVLDDKNRINLHRYKLLDGTYAEEYLQYFTELDYDQCIYFLGLKTNKRYFKWPSEKIIKKLKKKL